MKPKAAYEAEQTRIHPNIEVACPLCRVCFPTVRLVMLHLHAAHELCLCGEFPKQHPERFETYVMDVATKRAFTGYGRSYDMRTLNAVFCPSQEDGYEYGNLLVELDDETEDMTGDESDERNE